VSRPADLAYVVPVWAPNTNYPVTADPWSATPTKTAHSGAASVGITPKTGVAAQVFNKVINDAYTAIGAGKVADQTILDHVGQLQALNFGANVTGAFVDAVWNKPSNQWWAIETTVSCRPSTQNGWTWGANFLASSGPDTLNRIAVDTAGNMVVTATTNTYQTLHEYNISTNTWARRLSGLGASNNNAPTGKDCVVFDPASGLWCHGAFDGYLGANAARLATSSDRSTWTARSFDPGATLSIGLEMASNGVSTLVLVGRTASGTSKVWTSANGGVSWTARADISHGISTGTVQEFHFCPALNLFFYLVGDSGTAHKLYSSADGVAWTLVHSVATKQFTRLSSVGRILLANTSSGSNLVFSLDGGASWRYTGYGASAGSARIVTSGEQVLLLNAANVVPGLVAGYGHGAVY
jgi:hypothetical protein